MRKRDIALNYFKKAAELAMCGCCGCLGTLVDFKQLNDDEFESVYIAKNNATDKALKELLVNLNLPDSMSSFIRERVEENRQKSEKLHNDFTRAQSKLAELMNNLNAQADVLQIENNRFSQMSNSLNQIQYAEIERKYNENCIELSRLQAEYQRAQAQISCNNVKLQELAQAVSDEKQLLVGLYSAKFNVLKILKKSNDGVDYVHIVFRYEM